MKKHDYDTLERQYVQGTMSLRELAKDHGIAAHSTVAAVARRRKWGEKRADFAAKLRNKETEVVVAKRADILAKALDDAIGVANRAIFAFLDSLSDRWVEDPKTGTRTLVTAQIIEASDFVKLMDKLMVLNGSPTKREEHLGLNITADADSSQPALEVLRDIIAATRGADAAPTSSSPLPRSEAARKVN
jgi:hypothetical protein